MKKIYDYVQNINEGRPKGSKNKSKAEIEDYSNIKIGKDAEHNGSEGKFAIDEPEDDEAVPELTADDMNDNIEDLMMKFDAEEPFFILGKAGWGKTSIVKDMAKRYHRKVVTVYLDKAVATDLGGIPVPVQGKTGAAQELAIPAWAKYMEDRPDEKFLLFFDEMNQAAPDVMNALMPIVLENEIAGRKFGPQVKTGKKDKDGNDIYKVKESNYFVGAAGNFESENKAVFKLSGPLKSRFKPIINWETGTPESWKAAFKFIRSKWSGKATDEFISILEDNCNLFDNPREVEQKIIQHAVKIKGGKHVDLYSSKSFLRRLKGLAKEKLERSEEATLAEIADAIVDFITAKETSKGGSRGRAQGELTQEQKTAIKNGMIRGWIGQTENGKTVKYGISKENIMDLADPEEGAYPELIEREIAKLEEDGCKWKYEKSEEWKKAGYKDPNEE